MASTIKISFIKFLWGLIKAENRFKYYPGKGHKIHSYDSAAEYSIFVKCHLRNKENPPVLNVSRRGPLHPNQDIPHKTT